MQFRTTSGGSFSHMRKMTGDPRATIPDIAISRSRAKFMPHRDPCEFHGEIRREIYVPASRGMNVTERYRWRSECLCLTFRNFSRGNLKFSDSLNARSSLSNAARLGVHERRFQKSILRNRREESRGLQSALIMRIEPIGQLDDRVCRAS